MAEFIGSKIYHPKRQTIRAHGKRRHARPGDELQLYCGMRTKGCFLIGKARCIAAERIVIWTGPDTISILLEKGKLLGPRQLRDFARADGFDDARDMLEFWKEEHGAPQKWEGVIVRWEPIR